MTQVRVAWAAVVAVLLTGCAPAEPPLTCKEQDALDTVAIEEIWPQGFDIADATGGACDESGDELNVESTYFPAHELPAAVQSLQDQGWALEERVALTAIVSRDGDDGRVFTAWAVTRGDEAYLAIGVDS